jgi:hypothetical protein
MSPFTEDFDEKDQWHGISGILKKIRNIMRWN